MWNRMKRNKVVWTLFMLAYRLTGEYQPPFGSVGHAIQSGKLTEEQATVYLDSIH